MWINGGGTLADVSAHTFYAPSSHIWPLFPSAISAVWASGAGGCAHLFGHGPVPELMWGSQHVCFLKPNMAGIIVPAPCAKPAAILHYRTAAPLLPSHITSQGHFGLWVIAGLHCCCLWQTEPTGSFFWDPTGSLVGFVLSREITFEHDCWVQPFVFQNKNSFLVLCTGF